MTYEDWVDHYKPLPSNTEDDAPLDGYMRQPFGLGVKAHDVHSVWTVVESDGGDCWVIRPGLFNFNALGYIVTEVPWERGAVPVVY